MSFNRFNKKTGNRLKQQNVDAESGEPIDHEDSGRGYEIGKGQYLRIASFEPPRINLGAMRQVGA
jgi:DNA end-binding protein Ku